MTHNELCKRTANWALRKGAWLALCEYQHTIGTEEPDVLTYGSNKTTLYEIKIDRSDFLRDRQKEARTKWKSRLHLYRMSPQEELRISTAYPDLYYIEAPHLGGQRYYVCPWGLIDPGEVPRGWGLYWYQSGRFYRRKHSGRWRADVRMERNLAAHAMRRFASGDSTGIIISTYERIGTS